MRTLRKQVTYYKKNEDRIESQSDLYEQNEQLWDYMDRLMDTNKLNSEKCVSMLGYCIVSYMHCIRKVELAAKLRETEIQQRY